MSKEAQQALDKMAENARELALEALKRMKRYGNTFGYRSHEQNPYEQVCEAITALEALAEQPAQQEPVATLWQHGRTGRTRITMPGDITDCDADWFKAADLYTSPPAQRTWVGLTDEERKLVRNSVGYNQFVTAGEYAEHVQKATEFKLLEKNT